ncbi:MAG: GAF domain-containing protein, partial [Deltaproteobacteria bacterium]|nr:GAF domain-containing protein [Deltaproteobacteria bacterium]
ASALPGVGWMQAKIKPLDAGLIIMMREVEPDTIEARHARQALLVGEIGVALTRERELRPMLERCTEAIVRNLDCAFARVWILDEGRAELVLEASSGLYTHLDGPHSRVPVGLSKIGRIAHAGQPFLTNDVAGDSETSDRTWARRNGIVAFAGYPLKVNDHVIGVLGMFSRHKLARETLGILNVVTDSIALGVDRKRSELARAAAEHELRAQAERLELMVEIGKHLSAEPELGPLVYKIANVTTRLAGAQSGAFFYRHAGRLLHTHAGDDIFASFDHHPLLAAALDDHEGYRCDDIRRETRHSIDLPVRSLLVVPVVGRRNTTVGALVFAHELSHAFTATTERLLEGVAAQAAIAIDNARLFDEASSLIAKLERTNRDLDQFAYVTSHDLKAPLRGIANLSQWIEDDLGDKMDEQAHYHMRLLRGRVTRLEGLIEGILAYSRADRDHGNNADVDVAKLAHDVWELLAPPATVHFTVGADLPTLSTARVPLQQVLLNLIGNAVKYNRDRPDLAIEVGGKRAGDLWAFYVKDNGVGIAPEFHDRIWGLFQTLEARDKVESTGIGLAVVRKIVEARGGKAWIESAAGAGATFWFSWPAEVTRHG